MRRLVAAYVPWLLSALLFPVEAQDFTGVPPCAVSCLTDAIQKAACSLTDMACQCTTNSQMNIAILISPCLADSCSVEDNISTAFGPPSTQRPEPKGKSETDFLH